MARKLFDLRRSTSAIFGLILIAMLALTLPASAAGGTAKGTIKLKDKTVEIKYAYLLKAPDNFEPDKSVSTVILTPTDISDKIEECDSASCATALTEGMTLGREDFGSTTRVAYWVVADDGMKQFSGNESLPSLVLTADTDEKMAGKFSVDTSAIDGPSINVEFDAPLAKEFK
jgi:hypothetical protein